MEAFFIVCLIGSWIASTILASAVDYFRHGVVSGGFFLGLLFGPLGLFAMAYIDCRHQCLNCGTQLNGKPIHCPACGDMLFFSSAGRLITKSEYEEILQRQADREAVEKKLRYPPN